MKILCVDDSVLIQLQIADLLADVQRIDRLIFASTCADALRLVTSEAPELMILDIYLPDGTGIQILEGVRRRAIAMKIIIFTDDEFEQTRRCCLALGADAFFHKSTEFNALAEAVKRLRSA